MKIYLSTPYFRSKSDERQAEFDACLAGNIENPFIDRIFLFIDDGFKPKINSTKINIIHIDDRLTYRGWLEFAADLGRQHIAVLANTDILFDETVALLEKATARKNRLVALARHEKEKGALIPHPKPGWSQDVWAVNSASDIDENLLKAVSFPLGVPRCDNKIVFEFAMQGWELINPFPAVRAIHLHESQVRNYRKEMDRTIIGGMGFISQEANLEGESKIELTVWPRKTRNISKVRIVDSLEFWDQRQGGAEHESGEIIAYDRDWQFPAITEKHAYEKVKQHRALIKPGCTYFAFPWATLIDKLSVRAVDAKLLGRQLTILAERFPHRQRTVTVCQHIRMLDFQDYFKDAGVTDVFWSHAQRRQTTLPDYPEINIHPFPLFPVQRDEKMAKDSGRDILFSFVGARAKDFYLTRVRDYILDELSEDTRGVVVGRSDWHYNKIVYDHQVHNRIKSSDGLVDSQAGAEFLNVLGRSIFSLCPSGSGPNSIRLWESISAGAIPVILADSLALPGDLELWRRAAVFCQENREAVRDLPNILAVMAEDEKLLADKRHALRQLWMLYGPDHFINDIEKLFVETATGQSELGGEGLPLGKSHLLELCRITLNNSSENLQAEELLLTIGAGRALLEPEAFGRFAERAMVRDAFRRSARRCADTKASKMWEAVSGEAGAYTEKISRNDERVLRVALYGRNANRSPLAYAPYESLFGAEIDVGCSIDDCDVVVFSASANIRESADALSSVGATCPQLVVLSEEPLWDTTWGFEFSDMRGKEITPEGRFDYTVLNHMTSSIFQFEMLPYFITTEDDYFVRYFNLFRRNAEMTIEDILAHWQEVKWRAAFFAEKRHLERYDFERPDEDLYGLSAYRTRVAEAMAGDNVLRCGKGWSDEGRRQDLPDWHLDKLATLDQRSFIVSGLENTHHPDYITEKVFDAFALLGVPLYYASPGHRIKDLVPEESFINLFGLSDKEAVDRIAAFRPDHAFAEAYLEAQRRLCALFSDPQNLYRERQRVVDETVAALLEVCER